MSRLFIIGAGFSNDIAGLPLGRDLANIIYHQSKSISPSNRRLREMADCYRRVWDYLQGQADPLVNFIKEDGTQIETLSDGSLPIDMEYLLSLIDLNTRAAYIPKGIGVDLQGCPVPYLGGMTTTVLENARQFALHQIAEIMNPSNLTEIDMPRVEKFIGFFADGDIILTFNYDLVIDQELYRANLWHPASFYGIGGACTYEKLPDSIAPNAIELIKLHGSVNWTEGSQIIESPDVIIHMADPYDDTEYFEGLVTSPSHPAYSSRNPRTPLLILPTYLKLFDKPYEIEIVNKAVQSARAAEEIYILGYSIPKADTVASLICSQFANSARVIIVNRSSASDLRKRLVENYGMERKLIISENSTISDWIDNDFEFRQYQVDQENEAYMQSMIDAANSDNPFPG